MAATKALLGTVFSSTTFLWPLEAWINARIGEAAGNTAEANIYRGARIIGGVFLVLAAVLSALFFKALMPTLLTVCALYLLFGILYSALVG